MQNEAAQQMLGSGFNGMKQEGFMKYDNQDQSKKRDKLQKAKVLGQFHQLSQGYLPVRLPYQNMEEEATPKNDKISDEIPPTIQDGEVKVEKAGQISS